MNTVLTRLEALIEQIRRPAVQLSLIVFIICYVTGLLLWQHDYSHFADPIQPVLEIQNQTKRLASQVTTGLHINNFPEFSFHKNKFVLDAIVWFKYPVGVESIKTVEGFSFQNGKLLSRSLPTIKIDHGIVTVSYQTTVEFKTVLDYQNFPITDHRLNIVLENRRVTPHEMYFTSSADNLALSDDLLVSTWIPERKRVKTGYIKSILHENDASLEINYPCVAYVIDFSNNSIRDLMSLYFPLFILFFISFFALLIDMRENVLRTSLISGALPTLVLFRLVIDNIAPTASKVTKVDKLYSILVFLAMVLLLFQVYVLLSKRRFHQLSDRETNAETRRLEFLNSLVFLFVIIFLLTSFTYTHII